MTIKKIIIFSVLPWICFFSTSIYGEEYCEREGVRRFLEYPMGFEDYSKTEMEDFLDHRLLTLEKLYDPKERKKVVGWMLGEMERKTL